MKFKSMSVVMSVVMNVVKWSLSLLLVVSALGTQAQTSESAQTKSSSASLTAKMDPNAARIAPPLNNLLKDFKTDPNAEAQIILRKTQIDIQKDFFSHATSYVAIYINSDEAMRDYSQISISFNSFYEDIQLDFAQVRTPEGQIEGVKPDALQIQSPTDENFYHDHKELLFSVPNVRKGSVIEFQYKYTDIKKIVPNQWFDSFSLYWWEGRAANQGYRADAIAATELSITAPNEFQFYSNDLTRSNITPTKTTKGDQQILRWSGKNIPKYVLQENMPRDEQGSLQLRISTMQSWNQVANWANALVTPHLVTDATLDKAINEIAQKNLAPEDKVKAVYQLLQDKIRYVFAHVGRGGYEPHNAFEVFKNGYGDCKDQSTLAVTLLRKLGIQADAALLITRSRGIPDMSVTGVSFDHMIVHIPAQEGVKETWFDTSGDKSVYPGFTVGIEGQPSLIVNANTQSIVTIPTQTADKHFAHFDLVFDKFDAKNTEAKFTLQLGGEFEQRLRGLWQYSRERDKTFRELMTHIYNAAEVTELNAINADSLWQSFYLKGRYKFANSWQGAKEPLTYGFSITQLVYLFTDFRDLHKPKDRLQDYENDPGYTLSAHIVFTRPSPDHIATLNSQGQNIENKYFTLNQKGHEENGNYVIDQTLTVKPIRLSAQEYADFYAAKKQLEESFDWSVTFKYDKNSAEIAKLQQKASNNGKAAEFISLARLQIKNGTYDQALESAKKAVSVEPNSGEAHYLLGLAQGYNELLEESDKSFNKAEALGYKN